MKQLLMGVMLTLFFVSTISAGASYEFNEEKMKTLGGATVLLQERDDAVYSKESGFGFVVPELMLELIQQGQLEIYPISDAVTMLVVYSDGIFDLITAFDSVTATEQEKLAIREQVSKYLFQAGAIMRTSVAVDQALSLAEIEMSFSNVQKIAESDENIFYYAYNDDFSHLVLEDGEEEQFDELIAVLRDFKKNIFVFDPEKEDVAQDARGVNFNFSAFQAETLDGQTVDQSVFEDYDVTMVNVWATWCGPCVNEMPDLAELHSDMLPEGVNMITILTDVPHGVEVAHEIVDSVDGDFMVLLANESLNGVLQNVTAIPTTLMVDSNGNIIGSPIVAAPPVNPAETYLNYITIALESIQE